MSTQGTVSRAEPVDVGQRPRGQRRSQARHDGFEAQGRRRARRWPHRAASDVVPLATVSVVVPTLNEERNVRWVLRRIPRWVSEIILVDGRSTDRTVQVAKRARPDIKVVEERRPGKGLALRAGFAAAAGDLIVMIDADGSMDPREMDHYVAKLLEGYQFVKGSRFAPGGGSSDITPVRQAGNRGLLSLVNKLYRAPFTDLCYGYCAFRRDCLDALDLAGEGFEIETELVVSAVKAGLRIGEVASFEQPRKHGDSNLNTFRDGWRVVRTLLQERVTLRPAITTPDPSLAGTKVEPEIDTIAPVPLVERRLEERRTSERRGEVRRRISRRRVDSNGTLPPGGERRVGDRRSGSERRCVERRHGDRRGAEVAPPETEQTLAGSPRSAAQAG